EIAGAIHGHDDRPVVDGTRRRREMGVPVRRAAADPLRESRRGVSAASTACDVEAAGANLDRVIELPNIVITGPSEIPGVGSLGGHTPARSVRHPDAEAGELTPVDVTVDVTSMGPKHDGEAAWRLARCLLERFKHHVD